MWKMTFYLRYISVVHTKKQKKIHYELINWLPKYGNSDRQPKNSLVSYKMIYFEFVILFLKSSWFVTLDLVPPAALTPHYRVPASSLQTLICLLTQCPCCKHSISLSTDNKNKHQILCPETQISLSLLLLSMHSIYFTSLLLCQL